MSRINQFLQGIKVVDLSRHLPGPLATLMMVDLGADVIKVEPPDGEELRFIGPPGEHGHSAYFDAVNGGKVGLQLNLKSAAGQARLAELLQDADVLFESFRPGVLDKLDLSVADLRKRYPQLVICSLNGYGTQSPLQQAVGHDINYLAMNGVLEGTGTADQPIAPWPPLADCSASLFGLSSVLAALLERQRSGQGCHIEVALADAVMPLMAFSLVDAQQNGSGMPRAQALLNGGAARYRTYQTKDRQRVALGAVEAKFWQAFCEAAGRPEWLARMHDPLPQTALQSELERYFAELTVTECEARFDPVACCFNVVRDMATALHSDHMEARRLVAERDGVMQALYPAYVDGMPPAPRRGFRDQAAHGVDAQ
ncbi:CaiB/BaiF CoA transferase family protein [Ketobacter sp.]|uniref:CaiB/BaiF CoA transferase family protein n=1 Tax=Ketobacter sp. TaxID=2083498 RepID=UPI000F1791AA|nr:CoA transferase [Ketobacter sp.]RLU00947.1 MAG: CoA transferase [Ketobacter sp.]